MLTLRDAVLDALEAAISDLPEAPGRGALAGMLSRPPDASRGDLAFPCFPLAKALKTAPPKIAAELATKISAGGLIARVDTAGPYLNFFGAPGAVLAELVRGLGDGGFDASLESPAPQRSMVEFSQPNTHKVFHVGHLRNVAVGDALRRTLSARGHDVVAANYYGDFGIDVAKCLWRVRQIGIDQAPNENRGAWLGTAYVEATATVTDLEESDAPAADALKAEIRTILDGINAGDPELTALYQTTRQWCLDEFAEVYRWLDVHFDTDFYESELEAPGHEIVDKYLKDGLFEPSQGAVICDLEKRDYKLGPALVRKSDGTSLYLTWDLVLASRKFDEFSVERSIYVVGAEQKYHFQQLFATLQVMGYERAKDCVHVAYELVMLPEGKMSSRKGKAIPFSELKDTLSAAIEDKMRSDERADRAHWNDEQWRTTIDRLAVACLRYGMLSVSNTTRVIFDIDAWTNLEGESGAYLMYGLARIAGIQKKGGASDPTALADAAATCAEFGEEAERALLTHLTRMTDILAQVERDCDPSLLATWVYEGTKHFSRFYHDCPVLKAEEPLRSTRLALIHATSEVLGKGLRTLGIEPVDEM